ncbi:MAG: LPS assembly protein LptD [Planctomycetes bacterium]|nr:LPS assembly protein LptD [Planctomycetota bacterium]
MGLRKTTRTGFFIAQILASLAAVGLCPVQVHAQAPAGKAEQSEQTRVIANDASLKGRVIHSFVVGQEQVSVVLDNFEFKAGDYTISGKDAVLWIRPVNTDAGEGRQITIFIEGDAKIVEPTDPKWTTTTDRVMLIGLVQRGRLTAKASSGEVSDTPQDDLPLYRRAVQKRDAARQKPQPGAGPHDPPSLVVHTQPTSPLKLPVPVIPEPAPATRPGQESPVAPPPPIEPTATQPSRQTPVTRQPDQTPSSAVPKAGAAPVKPVNFYAESLESYEGKVGRVTVAKGSVYLAQGDFDSDMFLELRAVSAVIFSGPAPAKSGGGTGGFIKGPTNRPRELKDDQPAEQGGATSRPAGGGAALIDQAGTAPVFGPGGVGQTILGVYLEGDVIIARGERKMYGDRAYYDFTNDKAVVLNAVFRGVQEPRGVPVVVRGPEARILSPREVLIYNAAVSTSDMHTPSYSVNAQTTYLIDKTPYDPNTQEPLGEKKWGYDSFNLSFRIQDVPLAWGPAAKGDFEQGPIALRRVNAGSFGDLGWGGETEWDTFRLLGLLKPEGFKARTEANIYEKGYLLGQRIAYDRTNFSGYAKMYGVFDKSRQDTFGRDNESTVQNEERGWIQLRHKQFLSDDWMLQFELSGLSDRNFLREYYPDEYYGGKEQETLIYAKKQKDNWAIDALLKYRLNRFFNEGEDLPNVSARVIGQPLLDDSVLWFGEANAGLVGYKYDNALNRDNPDYYDRFETRQELAYQMKLGPLNVVPYVAGRVGHWGEVIDEGDHVRTYGQAGVKTNMHFWRVYNEVDNRLLDVHKLKHIITPEFVFFAGGAGSVHPRDLYPVDPDIEQYPDTMTGYAFTLHQRLQTKRGPADQRRTVDWMRFDAGFGFFDNGNFDTDGRLNFSRPEQSRGNNVIFGDYTWNISDSTAFLGNINYDVSKGTITHASGSLAVARDPRLRYTVGYSYIRDLYASAITAGFDYKLSDKYTLSVLEQYDFRYDGGTNLGTSISIIRKMERWYIGLTFQYDARLENRDDRLGAYGFFLTLWPEGVPEFRLRTSRMTLTNGSSAN